MKGAELPTGPGQVAVRATTGPDLSAVEAATGAAWGYPVLAARAPLLLVVASGLLLAWPSSLRSGLAILGAVVGGLVLVDFVLVPRPGNVHVERSLPSTLTLGTTGTVAWVITNPLGRKLVVNFEDELAPSLNCTARRVRAPLPARRSVTVSATLAPSRRGNFRPARFVLRAQGPLGLVARQSARYLPGQLRVYPSFGSRREAEVRIDRARILEVGLRSARARGGGTDFEQLREYNIDDDSRRIDWAATARADRPIVRAYRAERNQRLVCLLDTGRAMAGQVAGVARLEHAMDAIMMLTSVAARMGDTAGLMAFDRQVRAVVPPTSGPGQLGRVIGALYDLEPQLAASDYVGAFTQILARFQRRAMLCMFTDLEEAVLEALLPSLPLIVRAHLLVIATVRDPAVEAWARDAPDDIDQSYRAASATSALRRRHDLCSLLRARGAIVVDALPGRLGPAATDAYLNIKAAGRL